MEVEKVEKDVCQLDLQNKQDMEAAALALFRAGYAVQKRKRKEGNKTIGILAYWR